MKEILGSCVGIRFSERDDMNNNDPHIMINLLIEDSENKWSREFPTLSSYWLDDLISVCQQAKEKLERDAEKSPDGYGYIFKAKEK